MPVDTLLTADQPKEPEEGIGLALSGGGYRAMVFHLGALLRLNEVGLLKALKRVSSVSGGSITAAVLGMEWKNLQFDADGRAANIAIVVDAVREMAGHTIDAGAVIGGILFPGSISDKVASAYDKFVFKGRTLQDLPNDAVNEGPRFVINATNIQSGALWRFSRPYMGDYHVGLVNDPTVSLARAVAASSAFPPILSPSELDVTQPYSNTAGADLGSPEFQKTVYLSDGGVYDNLGLETIEKRYNTLLVSDAGQKMQADATPATDWARHSVRVLDVIDNQVRSLRQRHLVDTYKQGLRKGCYWSVRANFSDYKASPDPLNCAKRDPRPLAAIPTRLQSMPSDEQERLINWGYAICDAALRAFFAADAQKLYKITIPPPANFPYIRGY